MVNINIEVEDTIHKDAKKQALELGVTLQKYIIESIEKRNKEKNRR